jgi:hypothetical protein
MDWRTSCAAVRDALYHRPTPYFNVWPGILVTTGHDARTITSTLFSSGNTGSDKSDVLAGQVFRTAVRIGVVGVTAINDDVAIFNATLVQEKLDEVVNGLAGHDEHHHTARLLELRDEVFDRLCAHNGLALCLCVASAPSARIVLKMNLTIVQELINFRDTNGMSTRARFFHSSIAYVLLKATT